MRNDKTLLGLIMALVIFLMTACESPETGQMSRLNELSYAFHYRNLDSTRVYAEKSLRMADSLGVDGAEALNNLAFVYIAKMEYRQAESLLKKLEARTNNQVELLVADIQLMRLCQRKSKNKDFYRFRERAEHRLQRIEDESDELSTHLKKRLMYARSEFNIVTSIYFYYVGLMRQSIEAIQSIDPNGEIQLDTPQLLAYWYNIGAGGILENGSPEEILQVEFDYLMRCYLMALEQKYPYWEAQAMQAISEHLQKERSRKLLISRNMRFINFINVNQMPDSLLAGNLAQRAYDIFEAYGDVYQTAGANRTLAECFGQINDYRSALACLKRALNTNKAIHQAPDLVASIREQLSLVYSAVDDKANSDRNRNIYLDLQEQTRQDRQLEARAGQLDQSSRQLNIMLVAVIVMIVLVVVLLFVFHLMRHRSDARFSLDTLLEPLTAWKKQNETHNMEVQERYEEIQEQKTMVSLHLKQNKRRNLEQRAKVQLVNNIMPFIDRMMHEINRLQAGGESDEVRQQRYQYIGELADSINQYNDVLTQWIQMRQGEVSLKIESFPLQSLFDIVGRGSMNYKMKGIDLNIKPTTSIVKADKTLTLFMINTIADNARKFTAEGGTIAVSAHETPEYVEISVKDNGCGMTEDQLAHVFDRTYTGGHGFGLKNCNGIIEKYKKISKIFSVCTIKAESEVGKGTHLFFRLPKGVVRLLLPLMVLAGNLMVPVRAAVFFDISSGYLPDREFDEVLSARRDLSSKASQFADSAYFSNINGTYLTTLRYADSCHKYIAPEDTAILLDISNETAVAALALHRWDLYEKNNSIYTRLFREASADSSLPDYVRRMQISESNKNVAIILLVLLLAILFPAYYFLYYRYRLNYRFCIDRINSMNKLLMEDISDSEKLKGIDRLNDFHKFTVSDEQERNLSTIVQQIRQALQTSIDRASHQETSIELAEDDLHRLQWDNYHLHVSNSVLDNCLSTLKHETMYYPSRIRKLVDGTDENLTGIAELAGYYKELYQILSLQAVRQMPPLRLEKDMAAYLFEILKKINRGIQPDIIVHDPNGQYVEVDVLMTHCYITKEQCAQLFTAQTMDLRFLICRQLVRDMGELTNLRACGIMSKCSGSSVCLISVIMPSRFKEDVDETVSEAKKTLL